MLEKTLLLLGILVPASSAESQWTEWGECDVPCGAGKEFRKSSFTLFIGALISKILLLRVVLSSREFRLKDLE